MLFIEKKSQIRYTLPYMYMEKRITSLLNTSKKEVKKFVFAANVRWVIVKGSLLSLFFLFIVALSLFPLDPGTAMDDYIIRIWTSKMGLPQDTVYDIVQDRQGYMWFGTDDGTVRFDGIRFDVFNKKNTKEIKNNSVTCLFAAADGVLWIGTFGGGVTVYKNGVFTNYDREAGLPNDFIWDINEDREGNTWIGTTGGGLVRFKDKRFTTYTKKDGLADNIVKVILEDSTGKLWVGAENGLTLIDKSKRKPIFRTFRREAGLADNVVTSIFEDSRKNLWIGTINGLNRVIGTTTERFTGFIEVEGLTGEIIHEIYEDKDKNLWIATERGLKRLRSNRVESLSIVDGLSDNSLLTICEDREGNLWIGTSGKGVNMLHDSKFVFFPPGNGLSENTIKAIYEDEKGRLWAGTNGQGLTQIVNGKTRTYTTKDGLNSDFVNSLWGDGQGRVWIGTSRGLNLFKNGVFSSLLPDRGSGAVTPTVMSIYEDIEKNLWVGTFGSGLYVYREGIFYQVSAGRGLPDNFVSSIAEDKSGYIWVGTNSGLTRISRGGGAVEDIFEEENYKTYSLQDGLTEDMVYDIYIDEDGILWIGTNGGGLNRLENEKFTSCTSESGLLSDVVYRIIEDDSGNLWMSSNKGIFYTSRRELNKFAAKEISFVRCLDFQEDDGLISSVCGGGFHPAGWRSKNGIFYFPTSRGIAAIDPRKVIYNNVKPSVVFEKVVVNGKKVDAYVNAKLPARTKEIEIFFTALSFTAPKKVKFSYRLSGYDERWYESSSREKIVYRGLKPGKYKFKVIACNNDKTWNYQGAVFSFSIDYKLTQQIWFQLTVIFAALFFLLIFFRRYRTREKKKKYLASTLEPWQAQHYQQKLLTLMDEEKPYIDPEITVEKLSKRLAISEKHLSQVLNENLHLNFNNFVNKYRIEEAKRKIVDPKEKDFVILKIAYDVGFNSKSVFNAAFKKFTGLSPSEYRKLNSLDD